MKRIFCFVLMLILASMLYGNTFKVLQYTYQGLNLGDLGTSLYALNKYPHLRESNPMASWYMDKPGLAMPLNLGVNYGTHKLSNKLYDENPTIAYVLMGLLTALKGYAVYNNIRQMNDN